MNKTHKRNIVALLVLVIAVAGMFLIVRKVVLDNARVTIASVMQAEEENLKRSVREWQKDLYLISREGTAARLARKAGRRSINTERTRLEETFRAYMRLRKDYIESIRLVDSRGNERVVVDRQGPSREYLKVFSEKFYRNAMAERPFRAVGTLATTDTGMAILDYAINIADQGEKIGVLSIRIDLDAIIENLKKSSGDVSFNHLYLFNKQEQLVFDKALLPTVEELENNSAIKIFSLIKQEGSAARMFEHDGSFWAFFDIDPLQMSLVLKMNDENLYETVLEKFVPISILFGFAIVALLLFRKGRRKFRRLGS
ncbi:MAG: cache domain-containing protein, partial [Gammaproteobacteria bacterium]|nr:cache domain-containing protein [Gammaproteobacteria bacterium]